MSDRHQAMSPFSAGRGTPGSTSYPSHPGTTHPGGMGAGHAHRSYTLSGGYSNPAVDLRPHSSSSSMDGMSSLTGAMDEMGMPRPSRASVAYASRVRTPYSQTQWGPGQSAHPLMQDPASMVPRPQSAMAQPTHARSNSMVQSSGLRGYQAGPSPRAVPVTPGFSGAHYSTPDSSGVMMQRPGSQASGQAIPSSPQQMQEEISVLRRRIKELEMVNEQGRLRIQDLERELAGSTIPSLTQGPSTSSTLTYGQSTPQPPSVHSSWKARTDARIRLFCSLNRAGNALCAWHDSRRERRAYPPRMAPPGYLNCGCTFEEALFEESLARHGVGSYHPGESVRMDPALRNPLLRVLQKRYNYQDGDFERDPVTGEWVEGEGNVLWERKLAQGALSVRKARTEDRR